MLQKQGTGALSFHRQESFVAGAVDPCLRGYWGVSRGPSESIPVQRAGGAWFQGRRPAFQRPSALVSGTIDSLMQGAVDPRPGGHRRLPRKPVGDACQKPLTPVPQTPPTPAPHSCPCPSDTGSHMRHSHTKAARAHNLSNTLVRLLSRKLATVLLATLVPQAGNCISGLRLFTPNPSTLVPEDIDSCLKGHRNVP